MTHAFQGGALRISRYRRTVGDNPERQSYSERTVCGGPIGELLAIMIFAVSLAVGATGIPRLAMCSLNEKRNTQ
jgi:hypothetical protein